MASRPSYRPGMPKLSRYGISKAPSSLNIPAAFFGSRNDAAVNSSSSSFAFFMYDPSFSSRQLDWLARARLALVQLSSLLWGRRGGRRFAAALGGAPTPAM